MKKSKATKARDAKSDCVENQPCRRPARTKTQPMKKKRTKKSVEDPSDAIIAENPSLRDCFEQVSVFDAMGIKQEDELMNHRSLLDSSVSHPLFDSIMDHNQFWHQNQLVSTAGFYHMPESGSPYDHLSPSDIERSNSPAASGSASKLLGTNLNSCAQSRKDKSLGLLCQR